MTNSKKHVVKKNMTNLSVRLNQIMSPAITGPSTIFHFAYWGWILVGAMEFLWENSKHVGDGMRDLLNQPYFSSCCTHMTLLL